jgi:hypothetical protein
VAVALAMKNFIAWYRAFCFLRDILDGQAAAPIIGKIARAEATQEEMARINVASFPRDISPTLRQDAANALARFLSVRIPTTQANPTGDSDDYDG